MRTVHFGGSASGATWGSAPSTSEPAGRAGGGNEASIKAADYRTPPVARAGRPAVGPKKYREAAFRRNAVRRLPAASATLAHRQTPLPHVAGLLVESLDRPLVAVVGQAPEWQQPWQRANSPGDFTSPTAACSKRRVSRAARVRRAFSVTLTIPPLRHLYFHTKSVMLRGGGLTP